jgi:molybdopterin-guanine dinucleotide biosynthesis adapter protein
MKIFGFAGYSGAGKTTLIEQLIPLCVADGLKVSLIKQSHHDFEIDRPGKDSYRHRMAGCSEVLLTSPHRWALVHELRGDAEPTLTEHAARLSACDLLLVEGFKHEAIPKLEVHRSTNGKALLFPHDAHIVAVASDTQLDCSLPRLDLNDVPGIYNFIRNYLAMHGK